MRLTTESLELWGRGVMSHGRLEIEVLWSAARVDGLATAIKRPETAQGHLQNCKLLYSRGNPLHALRVNPTPTRPAALPPPPPLLWPLLKHCIIKRQLIDEKCNHGN